MDHLGSYCDTTMHLKTETRTVQNTPTGSYAQPWQPSTRWQRTEVANIIAHTIQYNSTIPMPRQSI